MAAAAQIVPALLTLEEYLNTSYRPDCDFVDGILEERNMGTPKHGLLQMQLGYWFISHSKEWNIRVMSELRTLVSAGRVRLPDVAVVKNDQAIGEEVLSTAPLIAIEILSPEDPMNRVVIRLEDFLRMGIPNIWVLDPLERAAFTFSAGGLKLVSEPRLTVQGSPVYLDLPELFSALDSTP